MFFGLQTIFKQNPTRHFITKTSTEMPDAMARCPLDPTVTNDNRKPARNDATLYSHHPESGEGIFCT